MKKNTVGNLNQDVMFKLIHLDADYSLANTFFTYEATPPSGAEEYLSCTVTTGENIYFAVNYPDGSQYISTSNSVSWNSPSMKSGETYELVAFSNNSVDQEVTVHIDSYYIHI